MASISSPSTEAHVRTWHYTHQPTNQSYLLSTDPKLVDRQWLNNAFDSKDMYWAKRIPLDQMEAMLAFSQSIGVYRIPIGGGASERIAGPKSVEEPESPRTPSPTMEGGSSSSTTNVESTQTQEGDERQLVQVGYARLITDYITTSYLTDVYVDPASRGLGLATFLMRAIGELMETMPAGRRGFLVASPGSGEAFYQKELGFWDMGDERGHAVLMTKRFFELEGEH